MEEKERARRLAANLVAARMYTSKEVYDRLLRKGISETTAEAVVADFLCAGILDDSAYARMYMEDSLRLKAKGMYRIRQELMQKGISRQLIDEAANEVNDNVDSTEVLRDYLKNRLNPETVRSQKELEKWKAKLLRRGYTMQEISSCLSDYKFCFDEDE